MSLHDENNDVPISPQKYRWWIQSVKVGPMAVPRIGLLLSLLTRLHRPGCPGASLMTGYFRLMKFRAGEQDMLVEALPSLDSAFFDGLPTRNMVPPISPVRTALAEATLAFIGRRLGTPTNGTPAATHGLSYDAIMEAAVTRALAQATARPVSEPESEPNCTSRMIR